MVRTEPAIHHGRRARARAVTEPAPREGQASSLHPSVQVEQQEQPPARTATASSLARRDPPEPQAALLMARELLRYRPAQAGYDAWLARVTELVDAAGDAPAPSRSLPPPPSPDARAGRGVPPPPPNHGAARRRAARSPEPPHDSSSSHRDNSSCRIIQRAPPDARVILERQRDRQNRTIQDVAAAGRQNRAALAGGVVSYSGGCLAFTRELRRVVWPMKFKPELPPRFDGTATPWSSCSSTP